MSKNYVLGLHPYGHDSSIALIDLDNENIIAYNLERFTRVKHDFRFCDQLIREVVNKYEIREVVVASTEVSVDSINYFHNLHQFEITKKKILALGLLDKLSVAFLSSLFKALFLGFKYFRLKRLVLNYRFSKDVPAFSNYLRKKYEIPSVRFNDHHRSHAASSYFLCPWIPGSGDYILTLDGQGDDSCSKLFKFDNGLVELFTISNHHSFNLLYTRATAILGFTPNADEGKLEALACYSSDPRSSILYVDLMNIFQIDDNLGLKADWEKVGENISNISWQITDVERFLKKYFYSMEKEDFAAAVQTAYEDTFILFVKYLQKRFGFTGLLFSGGGFANVKLNMRLFESGILNKVFVCPAMGDDGIAIGCALERAYQLGYDLDWVRKKSMPYFGDAFSKLDVLSTLKIRSNEVLFEELDSDSFSLEAAKCIYEGQIIALYQGRMEFGPRALGNRSILGNPMLRTIRDDINLKFKKREYFQPFCPTFLEVDREVYFKSSYSNKHMTSAFSIREEFLNILPGIIHIDGTCRAQFLEYNDNPTYFDIITKFKSLSGYGVLLDTSFNIHGKTIVRTPDDAVDDFLSCSLDALFIEGFKVIRR